MNWQFLADTILILHVIFILFVILGFIFTIFCFFKKTLFNMFFFRTVHLVSILYVAILEVLEKFCPLTILEDILYQKHTSHQKYSDSFISHYIEKLVYPDVSPEILISITVAIALFTILVYIFRPPEKFKKLFLKK